MVDLIELGMVDFDVILGKDWILSSYASIDCVIWVVTFHFQNEPVIEWSSCSLEPKGRFILYLKARKLVFKGCIYNLVWVNESSCEVPSLQSVPIVKRFSKRLSWWSTRSPSWKRNRLWQSYHSRYSSDLYSAVYNSTNGVKRVERIAEWFVR